MRRISPLKKWVNSSTNGANSIKELEAKQEAARKAKKLKDRRCRSVV